jgi:predicted Ser/Thr protein kinase
MIGELSRRYRDQFQSRRVILPFSGFLELVQKSPRALTRNAAEYMRDVFDHFGVRRLNEGATGGREKGERGESAESETRFKLFDLGTEKSGAIVGGESVQAEIYAILQGFVRQGASNKLILLHGPNGSAKTSTLEAIAWGMQKYSELEEGAVYTFNWIFPTEKVASTELKGEASGPIGFARGASASGSQESYANLEETLIASKIHSDFKDNPIFLIPMPQRELWLREWIAAKEGARPEDVELPPHLLQSGLSKRNQLILENLLSAFGGDLAKVLRHVQVERFFYSRQYRVGISTVEPQMAVDAAEKQLTMDKNIANLPPVLHNIRYYEAMGELIEANRGMLEFSDLLKRPLEAFKYLLTTVEKSAVSLPSSTANLDMVFMATTNEKHLDTFKTIPDFSSFRGRFELVTVPYLLCPSLEAKIYERDVTAIRKFKTVAPHAVEMLCVWAVMTRYKQPDPEYYDSPHRGLIARLDPRSKARLYERETLRPTFKAAEESQLRELRDRILGESVGMVVYEGRFGASPREIKQILHRAAQQSRHPTLTAMAVFDELERIIKDRTVYEFLQFEPRGKYHDAAQFISVIKDEYADIFEAETMRSMSMVAEAEYDKLLARYVESVVADVKKEKIYNTATEQYEAANQPLMREVERILGIQGSVERHREGLLSRLAAWRIDHPKEELDITVVFQDILSRIEDHYFTERKALVQTVYQAMLALGTPDERTLDDKQRAQARQTFEELQRRFGYDESSARESLKFMLKHNKKRKKS